MKRGKFKVVQLLVAALLVLSDPQSLFGCGPFAPEVIFTHTVHPDFPLDRFARGELGVLQPTYARSYLVAAYRHLNGVGIDAGEEKALVALWRERLLGDGDGVDKGLEEWLAERQKITAAGKPSTVNFYYTENGQNFYYSITNCQSDAFKTAARTLRERAQQFGASSATVVAWTQAQDQVFATCSGEKSIPGPIAADATAPARADRTYQIAAANFYARNYDESARLFGEIAKDNASPWRGIAPLLVARSLIRNATVREKNDLQLLAQAETELKKLLNNRELNASHESAQRLLKFVQFRLDPEKRARELAQAVLAKNSGATIKQDVIDYTRLLDRYENEERKVALPAWTKEDDLTDWLFTFQSTDAAALEHSLQRWAATSSTAWLIASLSKLNAKHPQTAALLAAAAKVSADSPAFQTLAYQQVRLMMEAGQQSEARQKLDELLALKTPMPASARNRFLAERMKLARNAEEFFKFAQRPPATVSYNEDGQELPVNESWLSKDDTDQEGNAKMKPFLAGRVSFASDSADAMNSALPLAVLKDAALGKVLPAHLRRQVAVAAWTRAVLLDDDDTAKATAPALLELLPEMKAQLTAYLDAKDAVERKDAALYLLLKFPGMRPYVDTGMARTTAHSQIDNYRDNWWCGIEGRFFSEDAVLSPKQTATETPSFLSAAQKSALAAEKRKLAALEIGPNDLCQRAVAWAKRNPADPRVPEALHLAVKATRYGCRDKQTRRNS
ncbi:MAG TPA: hypothetical protein PKA34_20805, partial [Blastocatellia bacterium]|nr:hypothetical protein [Blastocatellia bacterium]HNG30530.1 hypothetical protein [Blastocatellia bacterium]